MRSAFTSVGDNTWHAPPKKAKFAKTASLASRNSLASRKRATWWGKNSERKKTHLDLLSQPHERWL